MSTRTLYIYNGESDSNSEVLELLKDKAKYLNIEVLLINLVEQLPKDCKVLIIEPFDINSIKLLWKRRINIYSANYALFCFNNEIPLPKTGFPLSSSILKDKVICCSDLDQDEKVNISFMVQSMLGEFSKDFTTMVTHLVVGKVGSRKYHSAKKFNIPIMTTFWINDLWKLSLNYIEKEPTISESESYKCPCFLGLIICVTGFSEKIRKYVKSIVNSHGGTYSPELIMNKTTHLIVGENRKEKKYEAARRWKIPCLTLSWLEKCVDANYCLETAEFLHHEEEFNDSPSVINQSSINNELNTRSICNYFNKSLPQSFLDVDITNILGIKDPQVSVSLNLPFKDIPFYISLKYESTIIVQLASAIQKLGGTLIYDQSTKYTYYITDYVSDLQTVNDVAPLFVSSKWIFECLKENLKLPEAEYLIKSIDEPKETLIDDQTDKLNKSVKLESLNKHLQDLMSFKKISSEPPVNNTDKLQIEDKLEHLYSSKYKSESLIKNISQFNPSGGNPAYSQTELITYDDPDAKSARDRLIGYFRFPSEEDRLHYKENQDVSIKQPSPISPYISHKKNECKFMQNTSISEHSANDMYFLLSSLDVEEKIRFSAIITKLKGNVIETNVYEDNCTHTVVGKISRSQKFLCSIAAGKWILKPSFLEESDLLGSFAKESNHEWGIEPNPSIASLACHRWRINKQETRHGAFGDFKVLLVVDKQRVDGVFRVLKAGDATIIEQDKGAKLDPSITHIIVDNNTELSNTEIEEFKTITSNIYQPEYILEYLLCENTSALQKYLYLPGKRRKRFNKITNSNIYSKIK